MYIDTNEVGIQKKVIELLKKMGYKFINTMDIMKHRKNLNDVLLRDILKAQLKKINKFEYKDKIYDFDDKNIENAISKLDEALDSGLISTNEKIYEDLILGTSLQETINNDTKSYTFKYIDFKNIENNVFHFTEEFEVNRIDQLAKDKTRRPDIVLFINGIPFGVIELKSAKVGIKEGISQMIRNQKKDEIPHLFKFAQILMVANTSETKYATVGTQDKFWSIWREEEFTEDDIKKLIINRTISDMDMNIFSIFNPKRVLELIYSFILFDNNVKKIARYQQYFGIKEIINTVQEFNEDGRRKGGLIWHTQGSGKSLTMVMLARLIKRTISGSKIVVVTDRVSLDEQIHSTFKQSGIKDIDKAETGKDLLQKIKSGKSMITTIINKFVTVSNEKVVNDDNNIFVLVDESHRTNYGELNKAMNKVFPKASYLAFTGTPLMNKEKNSFKQFGGLLHKYTIDQAIKDGAILPLLYEGRFVEQWINDKEGMDRKFNLISKNLSDKAKKDLKEKWARFQKLASTERRIEAITLDISNHFLNNFKNDELGFKAMLATSSKYDAIKYYEAFKNYGDIKVAFTISDVDSREGHDDIHSESKDYVARMVDEKKRIHGSLEEYEKKSKDEFVNGDGIDLLIVVDKLLTGFDAPKATILYIDKELKEHKLLQAIARVNRIYEGKDFGYIIDYRGLLQNLDEALTKYGALSGFNEEDLEGAFINIMEVISSIREKYSRLKDHFAKVKSNDFEDYIISLEDNKRRETFYELLRDFAKVFKILLSSEKIETEFEESEINEYKRHLKFYNDLRAAAGLRYAEAVDFKEFEPEMQKLMDTYISSEEVNQLTKLVNIFDLGFEEEVENLKSNRAKADTIKNHLTKYIQDKKEENPIFYNHISRKIEKILEDYKNQRINDEKYLENIMKIQYSVKREEKGEYDSKCYPKNIKDHPSKKAIYNNIESDFFEICEDEDKLGEFTIKVVRFLKEITQKPDWESNIEVQNKIDGYLEGLIWEEEDRSGVKFENIDIITEKIKKIALHRFPTKK